MLWEVAVLNKMYKTKDFRKIKSRAVIGKVLFIITSDDGAGSLLESIKEDEFKLSEDEHNLFRKYECDDLVPNCKDIPFYSRLLYFYDCAITLSQVLDENNEDTLSKIKHWVGIAFKNLHGKGPESTTFEYSEPGLKLINSYLSLRACMINYSLSCLDIIIVSSIKHNSIVLQHLLDTNLRDYENIKRLIDWVEGLTEITWDQIHNRDEIKSSAKKAKDTKMKLTGSAELIVAVRKKDINKARSILNANPLTIASVDMKDKKLGLAHIAVINSDLDMLKLLIEYKVNLELSDFDGMTPLYYAIEQKNSEIIKYLVDLGVNLNHRDVQDRSSVYWAASCGDIPNLKLLLDAGCDPNIKSRLGRTALSKACWNGFVDVVKCLLETGKLKINEPDGQGRTCLHNAVWGSAGGRLGEKCGVSNIDSPECAQLVLEHGAEVNYQDNTGNTPLNIACSTFGLNSIKVLMSFGADLNLKNNYGTTPFLSACFRGNYECCKALYEYPGLDPYIRTQHGYGPLELAIEAGKDRVLKWVIEEKNNNGIEYPGMELSKHDKIKLLHHSVNNPNNNCSTIKLLLEHTLNEDRQSIIDGYLGILNRALLRKSSNVVQTLIDFYEENKFEEDIKYDEVILEASIYTNNESLFEYFLSKYNGELPQICLKSIVFTKNEKLLKIILSNKLEEFKNSSLYKELDEIPPEFTRIIDNDILLDYKYFDKISHPIFNDSERMRIYSRFDPLQMSVYFDNSRIFKLIMDSTCYKASSQMKNGDNIVHLIVSQKFGDTFILQKLLERLEEETGSKENVKKDFLLHKSGTDGLDVLEYCAASKIHAPILYKYSSVSGIPEDDMYTFSNVIDVDIIHSLSIEEEEKLDKKVHSEEVKAQSKIKYKNLMKSTDALIKKRQFHINYSKEIGLDLSDINYIDKIPVIKDKPCKFINDLEELKICAEDLKKSKVLGVDLEFHSDKRTFIASLLQISTLDCDYIIDALILRETVGPILTPVFADPNIVKVFHGCDYDIILLLTDLEIEILNVFDTARAFRTMMNACTTSEPSLVSFEYLVSSLLGIKTNKFFQVAEWRLRPLPKVMMNYSRADSHYLHFIYAILVDLLADSNNKVELLKSTYEENSGWLDIRKNKPDEWKGVFKDFAKKMNKFMIQRMEKAGPKTYKVVVHNDK